MLTKLLKYDLRGTGRILVPVWVGSTAMALLAALLGCFYRSYHWQEISVLSFLTGLAEVCTALCMVALLLVCVFLCARRFYDLLGDAGYVYFTLPVKPWQHIASKLLCSVGYTAATLIILVLQMGMLASSASGDGSVVLSMDFDPVGTGWLTLYLTELALLTLEGFAVGFLLLFLCMAAGAQWPQHRLMASVGVYFGLSFASQMLTLLAAAMGFRHLHLNRAMTAADAAMQADPMAAGAAILGGILLILAAIGAILWAVTQYFISKKLNLG